MFTKRIALRFVFNNECCPFKIAVKKNKQLLCSPSLFLIPYDDSHNMDNLYYSKSFNDMLDTIFTGIALNYPVLLEGSSGQGKHTAINHICYLLNQEVFTLRITNETTIEELFCKTVLIYKSYREFL